MKRHEKPSVKRHPSSAVNPHPKIIVEKSDRVWWTAAIVLTIAAMILFGAVYRLHAGGVPLPNSKLTPGDTQPGVTVAQLCDPKFHTGSIRSVSESEKRQVYAEYKMADHQGACQSGCEIDHLISLEIGGSNNLKNLWPQPYAPPGAHQKDVLENYLHREVCAGRLSLSVAQRKIATDWFAAYQKMTRGEQNLAVRRR